MCMWSTVLPAWEITLKRRRSSYDIVIFPEARIISCHLNIGRLGSNLGKSQTLSQVNLRHKTSSHSWDDYFYFSSLKKKTEKEVRHDHNLTLGYLEKPIQQDQQAGFVLLGKSPESNETPSVSPSWILILRCLLTLLLINLKVHFRYVCLSSFYFSVTFLHNILIT